ncbi:MAG: hypothetical protein JOZ24_08065 [Candidatus Eremiobacteraeota bacterium]|nr:hypothetical protein [Candidatus Eremiobacteraeota bacterium]
MPVHVNPKPADPSIYSTGVWKKRVECYMLSANSAPSASWPPNQQTIGFGYAEAPLFTHDVGGFNAITVPIALSKPLTGDPGTNPFVCRAGIWHDGTDVTAYSPADVSSGHYAILATIGYINLDPKLRPLSLPPIQVAKPGPLTGTAPSGSGRVGAASDSSPGPNIVPTPVPSQPPPCEITGQNRFNVSHLAISTSSGKVYYQLDVEQMFELPACGEAQSSTGPLCKGGPSSRFTLDIFADNGTVLRHYCDIRDARNDLSFTVPSSQPQPKTFRLVLHDTWANRDLEGSDSVSTAAPF